MAEVIILVWWACGYVAFCIGVRSSLPTLPLHFLYLVYAILFGPIALLVNLVLFRWRLEH